MIRVPARRLCALLLPLLLLPAAATAAATPSGQGPAAPRTVTLRNGARVLLAPDARAAAVSVAFWVEAGLRDERPGALGLSHLAEHLSARGVTPGGDAELRRHIEALGGRTASFTSGDFTCFTHTVPRAALERVLELEAGRFGARPTAAMLEQDRASTREEILLRGRTNPLERPLLELYAAAFPGHPYRWPVLGSEEDLARITLKDGEAFLRARYAPDQTLITIVGDFDPDQALGYLRRHIEGIRARGGRRGPAGDLAAPERRRSVTGSLQVPVLAVGWRVPAGGADDAAALDLLSALLTGAGEGRLTRRLVEQEGSCLIARSGRDRRRDATLFWTVAVARPGQDSAAVERSLIEEVEGLAAEPVAGETLDGARRRLEVAMLLGRQSASDRGQALGTAQLVAGDWRDADLQLERLRSLTPSDLQRAAARTLVAARRTVVWLAAAPPGGGVGEGRP